MAISTPSRKSRIHLSLCSFLPFRLIGKVIPLTSLGLPKIYSWRHLIPPGLTHA